MEIKPQKNYKKPAFAVGLASLMVAAGTSGCTDGAEGSSGVNTNSNDTTTLSQPGDIAISTDSTTTLEYDGGLELVGEIEFDGVPVITNPEETEETSLAGAMYTPSETEILELDGDVVCPPDDENE